MSFSKEPMICSILASKTNLSEFDLSKEGLRFVFHASMDDISADWDIAAPANNVFLQRPYLTLLEKNPPERMHFCYLVFYKNDRPVGVSACQVQGFKADQSLQQADKSDESNSSISKVGNFIKSYVASKVQFDTLVCGNLLLTGEHGFYFDPEEITKTEGFQLIEEALDFTRSTLKAQKIDISVTLIKDYYEDSRTAGKHLLDNKYGEFTIQPNMVLKVRPDWKNFDDYKAAMYSKYRVRVKRAAKKGAAIVKKELSAEEIEANLDRLYELYEAIAKNAGFNVMKLNKTYFLELKKVLGDRFKLTAYYLDDVLVGYYTLISNYQELEAHFLGFDSSKNSSHQIYLNMLYDMVRTGIDQQYEKIIFARTALEIKSSVGAVAHDMYSYLRHKYNLSNRLLSPLYDYLKPDLEWTPRHPFKEE